MRQWYRFQNHSDPTVAELVIFDEIGKSFWNDDAVTAKQFIEDLKAIPAAVKTIVVRVNSPGGDVFDAVAITNALREQRMNGGRRVRVDIEGLAASAASIVIMGGDPIRIADNAIIMIHEPSMLVLGTSEDMLKASAALETVRKTITTTYQWHSELSTAQLTALMKAETWMSADMAIANGFATEKVEGLSAVASLDARAFARLSVPDEYRGRIAALIKPAQAEAPATAHQGSGLPVPPAAMTPDVLRVCEAGGCLEIAAELLAAGATLDQVRAKVKNIGEARIAAASRAKEITALCAKAKLPELGAGYISGNMPIASIKAHLTTLTAKLDAVEIDGSLLPSQAMATRSPTINVSDIYAQRNRIVDPR